MTNPKKSKFDAADDFEAPFKRRKLPYYCVRRCLSCDSNRPECLQELIDAVIEEESRRRV